MDPFGAGAGAVHKTRMFNLSDLLARMRDLSSECRHLQALGDQLGELRQTLSDAFVSPLRAVLERRHPRKSAEAGLWVVQGAQKGEVFTLPLQGVVLLGREEQANFVIRDPGVSRAHCKLAHSHGTFRIKDLGSQNGTLVNGRKIVEAQLQGGDLLVLGLTFLYFSHSVVQLAADLEDPGLWGREAFPEVLGVEGAIFEIQMRLSNLEMRRLRLEYARAEDEEEAEQERLEGAFHDAYAQQLPGIEEELAKAEAALKQLVRRLRPPPNIDELPERPAERGEGEADDEKILRLRQENFELKSHALELERRLRLAVEGLLAQAEILSGRGAPREAEELVRRVLAIDPANQAARGLATRLADSG